MTPLMRHRLLTVLVAAKADGVTTVVGAGPGGAAPGTWRLRRLPLGLLTAVIILLGLQSLSLAPSARAATSITINCATAQPITINGSPGDVFTFTAGTGCSSNWEFYNTLDYNNRGAQYGGFFEYLSQVNMDLYGVDPDGFWYQYFGSPGVSSVTVRLTAANAGGVTLSRDQKLAQVDNDRVVSPPTIVIPIVYGGPSPALDLTLWQHAYARAWQDEDCKAGWDRTWMQWPNNGIGGWACVRNTYAYYPDLPYRH